jgi:hypothetical protein
LLAGHSRSFNDEPFDSRGNKGRVNDLEHENPVCTQIDCGGTMSGGAVMCITRRCERDHESAHVGTDALVCPGQAEARQDFLWKSNSSVREQSSRALPGRTDEGVCPYVGISGLKINP